MRNLLTKQRSYYFPRNTFFCNFVHFLTYVAYCVTPHNWDVWKILGCHVNKKGVRNYFLKWVSGVIGPYLVKVYLYDLGHSIGDYLYLMKNNHLILIKWYINPKKVVKWWGWYTSLPTPYWWFKTILRENELDVI